MQNITHLFYKIVKTTITKLIHIKLINNKYKHKPKNDVNLNKILITYNTYKCFKMIVELNIIFTTFNEKNEKKILSNLMNKKTINILKNNIEFSI